MSAPDTARCPHCFEATNAAPCPHCGWQPGQDNPPPALALGRVLDGRYRIGRVLGHGGFGITYLAWDDNLQLRLAIKEYLPRDCVSRGPDGVSLSVYSGQAGDQFTYGLDRFLEEARTLAHFDQHPGIVTVKNFFRAHGTGYCVMDYVEGITLRQYLDQQPGGRISVAAALKLLMPVADALRAVHKEGLLHRDLAPDNIYLTQDGRIKLLDFGAARFAASEHSKSLSIILKPGYAPEEQYRTKGKQGPWTDVYGLAATLYRAITGQVPPESLDRMDDDDLVPPSRLGIAITPGQEATLLQALAVKAGDRYQSMAELQQTWLNGDLPTLGSSDDNKKNSITSSIERKRTKGGNKLKAVFILAIPILLVILILIGSVVWQDTPDSIPPIVLAPEASSQVLSSTRAGMNPEPDSLGEQKQLLPQTDSPARSTPQVPPLATLANPELPVATPPEPGYNASVIPQITELPPEEQPTLHANPQQLSPADKISALEQRFKDCLERFALKNGNNGNYATAILDQVLAQVEPGTSYQWDGKAMNQSEINSDGHRRIANRYLDLVDRDLARNKIKSAKEWFSLAESMDPKNPALRARRDRISAALATPSPSPQDNNKGQTDTTKESRKTSGYVIPGEIYTNLKGQQCRTIHQVVTDKNGIQSQGTTTACKTESGWIEVNK